MCELFGMVLLVVDSRVRVWLFLLWCSVIMLLMVVILGWFFLMWLVRCVRCLVLFMLLWFSVRWVCIR